VLIAGMRHCFKTALAVNYLLRGIFPDDSQPGAVPGTVLYVRLHDLPMFPPDQEFRGKTRLWHRFARRWRRSPSNESSGSSRAFESPTAMRTFWKGHCEGENITMRSVDGMTELAAGNYAEAGALIELDLKTGAISAEKALVSIWEVVQSAKEFRIPVTRVVLDDISRIGVSYPAVHDGEISQKLFITALARMLRERRIGLVLVGTEGEASEGDDMIARAKTVANTIINARFIDVYGERHVAVTGEGLAGGTGDLAGDRMESIPITIRDPEDGDGVAFAADAHQLDGLIGFSRPGDPIKRPGSTLYVFEEGDVQREYLHRVEHLLYAALGGGNPHANGDRDGAGRTAQDGSSQQMLPRQVDGRFRMIRFDSNHSAAMFDAVDMQYEHGTPQDQTVLSMLDEFAAGHLSDRFAPLFRVPGEDRPRSSRVLYRNVLLHVDVGGPPGQPGPRQSWVDLDGSTGNGAPVCVDAQANETFTCCLLDAIYLGLPPPEKFDRCLDFVRYLENAAREGAVLDEVEAMAKVLARSNPLTKDAPPLAPRHIICWYSQLRDWLSDHDNGSTVGHMTLYPLPGNGFTGDWHIGVLKGSVSLRLGKHIIDRMCSQHEQYERFLVGVGLPSVQPGEQTGASTFLVLPVGVANPTQRLDDLQSLHE
jgi:hypothetical protein